MNAAGGGGGVNKVQPTTNCFESLQTLQALNKS